MNVIALQYLHHAAQKRKPFALLSTPAVDLVANQ
jgi:hypothetical protein